MSHSQFHSIDLFILRHAWLNLWDKRMLLAESTRLLSLFTSKQKQLLTKYTDQLRRYVSFSSDLVIHYYDIRKSDINHWFGFNCFHKTNYQRTIHHLTPSMRLLFSLENRGGVHAPKAPFQEWNDIFERNTILRNEDISYQAKTANNSWLLITIECEHDLCFQ